MDRPDGVLCQWLKVGGIRFKEPFFEETEQRCLIAMGENQESFRVTAADEVPAIAAGIEPLRPSLFVFHVSRCGSTLVSQLLGLDDSIVTLSEVPFLDQVLRSRYQLGLKEVVEVAELFPAALALLGQRRLASERALMVKFDSWHSAFLRELRSLYPEVPCVLLYREPAAVIRSHRRQAGMHAVPEVIENEVLGVPGGAWVMQDHLPQVLAVAYRRFLEFARADAKCLLAAYSPDMVPVVESMADFAGISLTEEHREAMSQRAGFHAKREDEGFQEADAEETLVPYDCRMAYEALECHRMEKQITP